MLRYQPLATAVLTVVWTMVMAPLALVMAFHDGVSVLALATVVLVACLVLLTAYAVPALVGGKL